MDTTNLQRLWELVQTTDESAGDETSCDETQEILDRVAAMAHAGEDVAVAYPAVVRHLAVCPDCQGDYLAVRATLAAFDSSPLPEATIDPARIPRRQAAPAAPSPLASAAQRARAWLENLALRPLPLAGTRRGTGAAPDDATHRIAVPVLGGVTLNLHCEVEGGRGRLRGTFAPPQPQLRGRTVRLYTLTPQPEPQATLAAEKALGTGGRLAFDDLALDNYVLTLLVDTGETEIVLLGSEVWRP